MELKMSGLWRYVQDDEIHDAEPLVKVAQDTLESCKGAGNDFLGWLDLPENYDREEFARIKQAAEKIRRTADVLIVIGIGGSYLGARAAIEVTGVGQGLDNALDCMAPRGRVALLGCTRSSDFTIDYYRKVHGPGITLIGAHTNARPVHESAAGWWTTHDDIMAVQRLTAGGRMKLHELVSEVHTPDEAPQVYHRLLTERSFPVVQFDWSAKD